jgi:hypothetical protein
MSDASDELFDLLHALVEGELDEPGLARLEQLASASPAARQQYVRYMQLVALAERDFDIPNSTLPSQTPPAGAALPPPTPLPAPDPLTWLSRWWAWPSWAVAGGAAGAVCLLLASGAWLFYAVSQSTGAADSSASRAVATLVSAGDCQWAGQSSPLVAGARLAPGVLRLNRGLAEIVFDCGAQVVLEGPAELELVTLKLARLSRGKLVGRVPSPEVEFTVDTPDAQVTDLGTEFGLSVASGQSTEVHVLAGRVAVESKDASAERVELPAGEARRYGGPKVEQVALAERRFVRRMPVSGGRYPASLIAYWNFDELHEGLRVRDLAGGNHGSLEGAVRRTVGLVGSGALLFSDTEGELMNVGPEFSFTTGITIEALFVTDWDGRSHGAGQLSKNYNEIFRKEDGNQRVILSFQHDAQTAARTIPPVPLGPALAFGLSLGGEYSELDMPLDGRDGRPTVSDLADGRVHHVAATYDSESGRKQIYLDGQLCFEARFTPGTLIDSGGNISAGIGGTYAPWAQPPYYTTEPFSGTIDEVAVYRAALAPAAIARHHAQAMLGRSYFDSRLPATSGSIAGQPIAPRREARPL